MLLPLLLLPPSLPPQPARDPTTNAEEKLLEPYDEPVDIHIVLAYRESEDPLTPEDCTPETSTAVKLLKEEMNINLIYDWIANHAPLHLCTITACHLTVIAAFIIITDKIALFKILLCII